MSKYVNAYPLYMTSGAGLEGLLSAGGSGEAHKSVTVKELDVGYLAFKSEIPLEMLSEASVVETIQVDFELKNSNAFATSGVELQIIPYISNNYYTNGNIITVNSKKSYSAAKSALVKKTSFESQSFYFHEKNSAFFGLDEKLFLANLKLLRSNTTFSTEAHIKNMRAKIIFNGRYQAYFYDSEGTLLEKQTVEENSAPTAPKPIEKEGYFFVGWRFNTKASGWNNDNNGRVFLSDENLLSGSSYDVVYTAVYQKKPIINVEFSGLGNIRADKEVSFGENITYTFEAEEGYYIKDIAVDGLSIGKRTSYTFTNVEEDHSIFVTFSEACIVKVNPYENGVVKYKLDFNEEEFILSKSGETFYFEEKEYHRNFRIYAEPNEGYEIKSFTREFFNPALGQPYTQNVSSGGGISLSDGWKHTYDIKFGKIKFNINVQNNPGGIVRTKREVEYGDNSVVVVRANKNYIVKDIFVDGISVLSESHYIERYEEYNYIIKNIVSDHTVSVLYQRVVYVTIKSNENGSVIGKTVVNYNEKASYSIKANEGYSIDRIDLSGDLIYKASLVKSQFDFQTENLTEDKTLNVSFTDNIVNFSVSQPNEGGYIRFSKIGQYVVGSKVIVSVVTENGFYFSSWSNGSTEEETEVILNEDTVISVNLGKYDYIITALESKNGRIEPSIASGNIGDTVIFRAIPESGYVLDSWMDGSTEDELEYTITGNGEITAAFKKGFFDVKLDVNVSDGGVVTGGGRYEFQSECEIEATANPGYYFVQWSDGNSSPKRTILVLAGGVTYIAEFKKFEFLIDIESSIGGKATKSQKVEYGDSLTIEITNDIGYRISDVRVDGVSVLDMITVTKSGGRYILFDVKEKHSVVIYFNTRRYQYTRKLLDYYPPVIKNILDFIELMRVQEPLVGEVWDSISFAYENQFIDEASEEGIEGFEKDYSIIPSKTETLKERKQYLKSKWVSKKSFTYEWLSDWIRTSAEDKSISDPILEDYTLKPYLPISSNYSNILKDMREYVPANICIRPILKIKISQQNLYTATAFRTKIKIKVTMDINDEILNEYEKEVTEDEN